ncbi:MAG: PAS domain S-box protein [Betaproteobacteria bacterium]|nr:PAS domain S-box protein [Betaproteobacteria bacterium]
MNDYERFTRKELLNLVRELQAAQPGGGRANGGEGSEFPVFGEREQQDFEKSAHPIRIFDRETLRYLAVNDAALKLYGYTREEFLRLTPLDTRHPEEFDEFYATLPKPTGYMRFRGPRRHIRKDGGVIVVEIVTQDILYRGRKARLSLTMDVTDRIHAHEIMRQRQQEFETLAENLPDLVARFDAEHRYVYINAAVERLTGRSRQEVLGKTQSELGMPHDLIATFDASMASVLSEGRSHKIEFRYPAKDGERLFDAYHVPEMDACGDVKTVLCVARDITERRRAEEELRRQKKLLDAIIEHLPVGVVVKDARTLRYLLRNRMAGELTGLNSAETIGKRADEVYPPDLAEIIRESDQEALSIGAAVAVSSKVFRQLTGRIVHNLKVPVPDETGHYAHLVSIIVDLTDIERAQAALRRSEERLKQLLSMSPAAIFSLSLEPPFATTFISENVTAQVGWQPSDFTGSPSFWSDHVHPEDRAAAFEATARIATDGRYICEYRFRHKNGGWRWMHDEGQAVRDPGGTVREGIGIWMDITPQREEAEERLQRALRQRDALVKEVHHRIKNHLQGIAGLLRQEARAHPGVAPLIETMVAQMKSVALVYGLQNGVDTAVPLGPVLAAICASLEHLMPCRVVRKWDVEQEGSLRLDANEAVPIAVALNELVYNALKHGDRSIGAGTIEVDYAERGPRAEIRVANLGALPPGFDYATGVGCGTGLDLVKTLLGPKGSTLAIWSRKGTVQTTLTLDKPLVTLQSLQTAA